MSTLAKLTDALQKRDKSLLAAIRLVGEQVEVVRQEMRAVREELRRRDGLKLDPKPASQTAQSAQPTDVEVSTAAIVRLLQQINPALTSEHFKKLYGRHADLGALGDHHGRHRVWPIGAVLRWYQRYIATPKRGRRKTRP